MKFLRGKMLSGPYPFKAGGRLSLTYANIFGEGLGSFLQSRLARKNQ